jgi:hypothetical protein
VAQDVLRRILEVAGHRADEAALLEQVEGAPHVRRIQADPGRHPLGGARLAVGVGQLGDEAQARALVAGGAAERVQPRALELGGAAQLGQR